MPIITDSTPSRELPVDKRTVHKITRKREGNLRVLWAQYTISPDELGKLIGHDAVVVLRWGWESFVLELLGRDDYVLLEKVKHPPSDSYRCIINRRRQ